MLLPAALAFLTACGGPAATREPAVHPRPQAARAAITGSPLVPATWALAGRATPVAGAHAMVVSGHPLASAVGLQILRQGGNAIDAAVATGFALAVVLPRAGNIGGGGFLLYRDAAGQVSALDYRETAPARATRDMYVDSAGNVSDASVTGHLAAGVPGSVAGLHEMWRTYGRLTWPALLAPAIRLAEGHTIDAARNRDMKEEAARLRLFPASASQFLQGDTAFAAGTLWRQPDLARTLRLIADSGAAAFYEGRIAGLIADEMARGGGLITRDDLRSYRAKWRDPITLSYRGHTIYSMSPPSSGGITLGLMLNMMEGYDTLPAIGTAAQVHLATEVMRRAFVDRNRYLGDPDFVALPVERLQSKAYAAQLRAGIDPHRATPTTALWTGDGEHEQTTHYSIVDTAGNAAAVTTTLNGSFGSAVTVTGAGFVLNDQMDDFTSAPGRPNQYGLVQGDANAIAPGKRMLSAMTPSIVLDERGRLLMLLGTPGGATIITTVFQVITEVLDQKMALWDAVAAPRVHHQALPDVIRYELGGLAAATVDRLRAMGHVVQERPDYSGDVAAIIRCPEGWIGVADPRRGGGAEGW